jgi:hypothetical protein
MIVSMIKDNDEYNNFSDDGDEDGGDDNDSDNDD